MADAGIADPIVVRAARGEGLARARNEALERCRADVLALIDDDVVVPVGWREALSAAWQRADGAVAWIGGPVRLRFIGTRPPWVTEALSSALNSGSNSAGEIGADQATYSSGNLSYRADALRGVGGFWPARGHPQARDWYTEEHHAQRELTRAGWRSSWEPAVAAERVVVSADLHAPRILLSRVHTGARAALLDAPRPRSESARASVLAAAGMTIAWAGRDPGLATERAARAAENVGRMLGPVLAHRQLQPVTSSTPFRHAIAPPAPPPTLAAARRLFRRRATRRQGPIVLLYHRIGEAGPDASGLTVTAPHFASQLDVLRATREPVPLETIVAGDASSRAVAVTFDDGYADNLTAAMPMLERASVPATVFVATGHVASGRGFWWDELARLLRRQGESALRLASGDVFRAWHPRTADQRLYVRGQAHAWLQSRAPESIEQALRGLRVWAGLGPDPAAPPPAERPLTVQELRRLAGSPMVTVGSHTRWHPSLRFMTPERRAEELSGSRGDLTHWIEVAPAGFSYPFGVPGTDMDPSVFPAVTTAGYDYAVVNAPGTVCARTNRLAIPRRTSPDLDADGFAAWLNG
ncbi:MAG: polysaccharide deacetylase family protein [Actinomycetota bacterium]|nr:polysaccharide deacetylase family protein [Actinomycetota bacterium]